MDTYLEALKRDLLLRDLQATTQEHYVRVVREFLKFVEVDARRFTADAARDYLLRLRGWNRAPSTINSHHAGLLFWFSVTLGRSEVMTHVPRCKWRRITSLPEVPTVPEVRRLINAVGDPFFRALVETVYGTGMRAREVTNLRVEHICSADGVIRIDGEFAKRRRPRAVPLGRALLELLRAHWKRNQLSGTHLFPAKRWNAEERRWTWASHAVDPGVVNTALRRARVEAGIDKRITLHTLRHAYATHLLEHGVEMRRLQILLGHASISTTQFYTHLRTDILKEVPSPLDLLPM